MGNADADPRAPHGTAAPLSPRGSAFNPVNSSDPPEASPCPSAPRVRPLGRFTVPGARLTRPTSRFCANRSLSRPELQILCANGRRLGGGGASDDATGNRVKAPGVGAALGTRDTRGSAAAGAECRTGRAGVSAGSAGRPALRCGGDWRFPEAATRGFVAAAPRLVPGMGTGFCGVTGLCRSQTVVRSRGGVGVNLCVTAQKRAAGFSQTRLVPSWWILVALGRLFFN